MRWTRPRGAEYLEYWAQAARPLAFAGSLVTLYAVLVALPGVLAPASTVGGLGRVDVPGHAGLFTAGLGFAFELAVVILLLLTARDAWAVFRDRLVPPYDPYEDATAGLDRLLADDDVDVRRAARTGVRWTLYAGLLGLNVLVADVLLGLTWGGRLGALLDVVSGGILLSTLPDLLVVPLRSVGAVPPEAPSASALTAAVLYAWLPAVPLTVAVINLHAALYRAVHQGLYEVAGVAADTLARSVETWRSYT